MLFNLPKDTPRLEIGNRCGSTDYIDFLKWKEVTSDIMYGIDRFQRSFIVIKFMVEDYPKPLMQTFFQRYTDEEYWMGCGHATNLLIDTTGGMSFDQQELIQNIIDGKEVTIEDKHHPDEFSYCGVTKLLGKKVSLFDQKKHDASIVIQRAWKLCRYDPIYKMCETVLINNHKEIELEFNRQLIT
jgi:hypothetical protein